MINSCINSDCDKFFSSCDNEIGLAFNEIGLAFNEIGLAFRFFHVKTNNNFCGDMS